MQGFNAILIFAGDGNIGHIIRSADVHGMGICEKI